MARPSDLLTRIRDRSAGPGNRPPWPAAGVAVVLGAGLSLVVTALFGSDFHDFDLTIYRDALTFWMDGRGDLYSFARPDAINGNLGFTYPPFAALVLAPVAWLPLSVASHLMTVLTALGTALLVHLVLQSLGTLRPPVLLAATVIGSAVATFCSPIDETSGFGQINVLLAVLVAADVLVGVPGRRRWGGVGIGLAMAIKLTPGIFLLALLLTRRWRASGTAVVTAVAATLLAAAIAPRESWTFFTDVLWQTGRVGPQENVTNQALSGAIARWADPAPLPGPWWAAAVLVVLVVGALRVRAADARSDAPALVSVVGLVGLLVSPVSWIHHCVWVVPALVVTLADVCDVRARTVRWWGSLALLLTGLFVWFQSIRRHFDLPDLGYADAGFARQFEASLPMWWMVAALILLPITRRPSAAQRRPT